MDSEFDYKGFAEWLQETGLRITPLPEQPLPPEPTEFQKRVLEFIKGHKWPPNNPDDLYHDADLWSKFGCVGAGIGQHWCWYQDSVILSNVTDQDLCDAALIFVAPAQEMAVLIQDKFNKEVGDDKR